MTTSSPTAGATAGKAIAPMGTTGTTQIAQGNATPAGSAPAAAQATTPPASSTPTLNPGLLANAMSTSPAQTPGPAARPASPAPGATGSAPAGGVTPNPVNNGNPAPAITSNTGATNAGLNGAGQTSAPTMNSGILASAASASPTVNFDATTGAQTTAANMDAIKTNAAQERVTDPSLVQNQLTGILNSNSPLMQQAQLQANQQMEARGMVNSTMGQEAGQQAMIAAALPVAQQDAATQAAANQLNTQNTQQANLANQSAGMTANQVNTANTQQANLANQSANIATQQFNSQGHLTAATTSAQFLQSNVGQQYSAAANVAINNANNADKNAVQATVNSTQLQLANLQNSYGLLTTTNGSAQKAWTDANGQIQTILADTSLTPAAMNSQISTVLANLSTQMGTIDAINGTNIAHTIFNPFGTTTYGGTPANPGTTATGARTTAGVPQPTTGKASSTGGSTTAAKAPSTNQGGRGGG